ncbi:hypothetical protein EDB82DRAFT_222570 [Fusarium venenatum]|uniref:uncharacterized protein n=1 Tax=Fusarium venenatum TaxID=56646 RepID=UPI001E141994|nr:hypothetical protein EDB82DRAFT_222570 [Fusarium venenatum]
MVSTLPFGFAIFLHILPSKCKIPVANVGCLVKSCQKYFMKGTLESHHLIHRTDCIDSKCGVVISFLALFWLRNPMFLLSSQRYCKKSHD